MSIPAQATSSAVEPLKTVSPVSTGEIDASCRLPVMLLIAGSVAWLIAGLVLSVIASIKLHAAGFLVECPWLTYGRIRPAAGNALVYGFASQAGLAVGLWMMARLSRNVLQGPGFIAVGGLFWNLGVLAGVVGILGGDGTGFEGFEFPKYATPILFFAFCVIGICAILTFHARRENELYPSQWYLLAALLWFPWIYSTAQCLLIFSPVRGVVQAAVNGWAAHGIDMLWLTPLGLATAFYFLPKLAHRPLHSRPLAIYGFWLLAFFGAFGGVSAAAPLPKWVSAVSVVGTVCSAVAVLAVATNWHLTLANGGYGRQKADATFSFVLIGAAAGVLAGLLTSLSALRAISETTEFTLFLPGVKHLHLLGFLGMTLTGAIYHIAPRVAGVAWPWEGAIRVHFRLALAGAVLISLPLVIGGWVQGGVLNKSAANFLDVVRSTIPFLGMSTLGGGLLLVGAVVLGVNLVRLIGSACCCGCCGVSVGGQKKSQGRKS